MTTFGSTQEETILDPQEQMAMRVRAKTATLAGMSVELQIQKQQIAALQEQQTKVVGLVMTLQQRLEAINAARVRELQSRGHGPTA